MLVRIVTVTAVALVAGVIGRGDAGAAHRPSTLIGCESGVLVKLERLPTRAASVEVCAGGRCRRADVPLMAIAFVPVANAKARAGKLRVRVRVFAEGGQALFTRRRTVLLRAFRPNGGDCPPVCYQRTLRLVGDRLLVPPA